MAESSHRFPPPWRADKIPGRAARRDFIGTNLRGANLSGADLRRAILVDTDLTGADL
jgi:uncharacterized protein YjbI with pentapeptide repeats